MKKSIIREYVIKLLLMILIISSTGCSEIAKTNSEPVDPVSETTNIGTIDGTVSLTRSEIATLSLQTGLVELCEIDGAGKEVCNGIEKDVVGGRYRFNDVDLNKLYIVNYRDITSTKDIKSFVHYADPKNKKSITITTNVSSSIVAANIIEQLSVMSDIEIDKKINAVEIDDLVQIVRDFVNLKIPKNPSSKDIANTKELLKNDAKVKENSLNFQLKRIENLSKKTASEEVIKQLNAKRKILVENKKKQFVGQRYSYEYNAINRSIDLAEYEEGSELWLMISGNAFIIKDVGDLETLVITFQNEERLVIKNKQIKSYLHIVRNKETGYKRYLLTKIENADGSYIQIVRDENDSYIEDRHYSSKDELKEVPPYDPETRKRQNSGHNGPGGDETDIWETDLKWECYSCNGKDLADAKSINNVAVKLNQGICYNIIEKTTSITDKKDCSGTWSQLAEDEDARKAKEAADKKKDEDARKAKEAADKKKDEDARKAKEAAEKKKDEDARKAKEAADKKKDEDARKAKEAADLTNVIGPGKYIPEFSNSREDEGAFYVDLSLKDYDGESKNWVEFKDDILTVPVDEGIKEFKIQYKSDTEFIFFDEENKVNVTFIGFVNNDKEKKKEFVGKRYSYEFNDIYRSLDLAEYVEGSEQWLTVSGNVFITQNVAGGQTAEILFQNAESLVIKDGEQVIYYYNIVENEETGYERYVLTKIEQLFGDYTQIVRDENGRCIEYRYYSNTDELKKVSSFNPETGEFIKTERKKAEDARKPKEAADKKKAENDLKEKVDSNNKKAEDAPKRQNSGHNGPGGDETDIWETDLKWECYSCNGKDLADAKSINNVAVKLNQGICYNITEKTTSITDKKDCSGTWSQFAEDEDARKAKEAADKKKDEDARKAKEAADLTNVIGPGKYIPEFSNSREDEGAFYVDLSLKDYDGESKNWVEFKDDILTVPVDEGIKEFKIQYKSDTEFTFFDEGYKVNVTFIGFI